jgi:transcriptional regulator with XRE-family HTH domain
MPRTPAPATLGTVVRQYRERAGLTQAQLAERAGLADATISRVERGRLHPSADLIGKLASALGVTVDDLLRRRSPPRDPKVRASVARLVAAVEGLDDGQVDDVRKAVVLLLEAGRRSSRAR